MIMIAGIVVIVNLVNVIKKRGDDDEGHEDGVFGHEDEDDCDDVDYLNI